MNQRDIELLSAYLDGQLTPSDSARLETRLASDPELDSVLDDLRAARTLLRKLPQRRSPRNFTLTRKMVGLNPPLPRAYPAFRFATVVATLLFFFTFGLNTLAPQFAQVPAFGMGGGGGAPEEPELFSAQAPAATEAPAPAFAEAIPTEGPDMESPVESAADLASQPTLNPPSEDSARVIDTPAAKGGVVGNEGVDQTQVQTGASPQGEAQSPAPFVPSIWQTAFAVIAVLGTMIMALLRRSAINRWK